MQENNTAKWYVIHTYSGYEAMVQSSLEKLIENNNLSDTILDIKIPMEQTIEEKNGKKILKKFTYARKNIFSSETLHFVIIDLMASFISGLGAALALVSMPKISLALGIVTGIAVFVLLIVLYFRTCIKVYMPLEENGKADCAETKNRAFNRVFSKAWFLHFYHN